MVALRLQGSPPAGVATSLALLRRPPCVPFPRWAFGPAGAKNAAILAVQILALSDSAIQAKLDAYKAELAGR